MKVIHVIVGLNIGGAELMLYRLCSSLMSNSDDEHLVISLTTIGEVGSRLQASGIEVIALGMKTPWNLMGTFFKLLRELKRTKPDVVQCWMYHSDLLGGLAARILGIKHIIWGIRTTDVSRGGSKSTVIVRKVCAWLSSKVPAVIVCAAEASRKAHMQVGYAAERMVVIPNGFELDKWVASESQREEIRSSCGIKKTDLVIGSLGRFNEVKDHFTFVQAAGELIYQFPTVKFLMIGRDVDFNNLALKAAIDSTGCPQNFILLGERHDIPACFKAMDIFCLHSITEGFPNVLGEAMSMRLPCVTTDVGDAKYLLGGNGIVVPPNSPNKLSSALAHVLSLTPSERLKLGDDARERIASNFTMECAELKFKRIYERFYIN